MTSRVWKLAKKWRFFSQITTCLAGVNFQLVVGTLDKSSKKNVIIMAQFLLWWCAKICLDFHLPPVKTANEWHVVVLSEANSSIASLCFFAHDPSWLTAAAAAARFSQTWAANLTWIFFGWLADTQPNDNVVVDQKWTDRSSAVLYSFHFSWI